MYVLAEKNSSKGNEKHEKKIHQHSTPQWLLYEHTANFNTIISVLFPYSVFVSHSFPESCDCSVSNAYP
jgi:hypothetical protein